MTGSDVKVPTRERVVRVAIIVAVAAALYGSISAGWGVWLEVVLGVLALCALVVLVLGARQFTLSARKEGRKGDFFKNFFLLCSFALVVTIAALWEFLTMRPVLSEVY
jgi:hypothetical protein